MPAYRTAHYFNQLRFLGWMTIMIQPEDIRDYVNRLVERFHPQAVLLFGSQASGTVTDDSDVDLLVVMDHDKKRDIEQEITIDCALQRSFPLDILVKRPADFRQRLAQRDMALEAMVQSGKLMYERADA
jgi:predicted nucleotidyltransferase